MSPYVVTRPWSIKGQVHVGETYGCPILNLVAVTWQRWEGTRIVVPIMATRWHVPLLVLNPQLSKTMPTNSPDAWYMYFNQNTITELTFKPARSQQIHNHEITTNYHMLISLYFHLVIPVCKLWFRVNPWSAGTKIMRGMGQNLLTVHKYPGISQCRAISKIKVDYKIGHVFFKILLPVNLFKQHIIDQTTKFKMDDKIFEDFTALHELMYILAFKCCIEI